MGSAALTPPQQASSAPQLLPEAAHLLRDCCLFGTVHHHLLGERERIEKASPQTDEWLLAAGAGRRMRAPFGATEMF